MGSIGSCCPCFDDDSDVDSLEKASSATVNGELESEGIKKKMEKRLNKDAEIELRRQQSRFFRKNAMLESQMLNKENPFLYASKRQIVLKLPKQEHMTYFSRIKRNIKPTTNKASTMDENESAGEYCVDRTEVQSNWEEYQRPSRFEKEKGNLTFSHPPSPVVLENEYRTVGHQDIERPVRSPDQMVKLTSRVGKQDLQKSQLSKCYMQLALYKLQKKDYSQSEQYICKLLDLVKEEDSSSKDTYIFKGYVLGGIVFFLREKTDEALECLLKALRLEINEKGGDSLRLIEVYYWLGETYAKLKKYYLAKNYYSKAYRLYGKHEVLEPKLLANICLQLGLANIRQEEYAEADKLFEIGVGKAEESGDFSIYIQILLKSAENDLAMGSYKQTLGKYARVFKIFRECKCQQHPIFSTAVNSLSQTERKIKGLEMSSSQKKTLIRGIEDIKSTLPDLPKAKVSQTDELNQN